MNRTARLAWPAVVGAALALSWWSLFTLARSFGVPVPLAAVVSTTFDGGALVLGDLAQRYARSTDSGFGARLGMLALVCASVWLNWQHAILLHYPLAGRVLYAAPAAVAGMLFELERRYRHRESLRQYGRVAPALPVFGRWAWLLFPGRSWSALRTLVGRHLDAVTDMPGQSVRTVSAQAERCELRTVADAVRVAAGQHGHDLAALVPAVRELLGDEVNPETIRRTLHRISSNGSAQ